MYRMDERFAEWTPAERAEYAALQGGPPAPGGQAAPGVAVLRETLLALRADAAADERVLRELARVGAAQEPVE